VPADRRAAATKELEPVFAALADMVRQVERQRRRTESDARALLTRGEERARALVERARVEAEGARSAEEARVRSEAAAAQARLIEAAQAGARATLGRAQAMSADVAARVVSRVRDDIADLARSHGVTNAGSSPP
jgi:hypothetical protein